MGLAYRMLGSLAEAEDAVQEAYLRWHAADRGAVENPRAFLSTIVTRLCLDQLEIGARAARELFRAVAARAGARHRRARRRERQRLRA